MGLIQFLNSEMAKEALIKNVGGRSSFLPHVFQRNRLVLGDETRDYFDFLMKVDSVPHSFFYKYAGKTIAIPHRVNGMTKGYGIFLVKQDGGLIGKTYLLSSMSPSQNTIVVEVPI